MLAWYLLGRINFIYLTKKTAFITTALAHNRDFVRRWAGWALAHVKLASQDIQLNLSFFGRWISFFRDFERRQDGFSYFLWVFVFLGGGSVFWWIFRESFSHCFWLLRELPSCRPFSSRHICTPRRSCLIRYIARLSGPRSIGIITPSLPLPFITSWLSLLFWFSTHAFISVSGPGML